MPSLTHPQVEQLAERSLKGLLAKFPSVGSRLGLREYDPKLQVVTIDLLDAEVAELTPLQNDLDVMPAEVRQTLAHRALTAQLARRRRNLTLIREERRDLGYYAELASDCVFELIMRRAVADPATADAIASRLEKLPTLLDAAMDTCDEPVRLWTELAIDSAEGGIAFFESALRPIAAQHTPEMQSRLEQAAGEACTALTQFAKHARKLLDSTDLDPAVACGEDVLANIIKNDHGLTLTPSECAAWARKQITDLKERLKLAAERLGDGQPVNTQLNMLRDSFAERVPPMQLLQHYQTLTARMRHRLVDEKVLPLPPGESCQVIPTPSFLTSVIPTAAYSNPGMFDPQQVGLYFVTEPTAIATGDDIRTALRQHAGVLITSAHEAYPGHHVQLCWANQAPSLALKLADHIIFMEGWTLYCEQMCVERGWLEHPAEELMYLQDQLWRACRIVIDTGVHSGSMSVQDGIDLLVRELGFTPQRATAELNWYTRQPGTPMSYLLGKYETLHLRDLWRSRKQAEDNSDWAFHQWLLSFGSVPQTWLKNHMPQE